MNESRAHLVHVVHRFDTGGMENGLVNLVNLLPADRFRHTIVPLTDAGRMTTRVTNPEVRIHPLGLRPGPLAFALPKLWRLFRCLRPSIVHTRNVGTLEAQIAALLAGVPVRIHGEHGWEMHDLVGSNVSLLRTRKLLRHLVHAQVALSKPTFDYLRERVGVPATQLKSICNGVETGRFRPPKIEGATLPEHMTCARDNEKPVVIGYVGRLADVKNPLLLVDAFEQLRARLRSFDDHPVRPVRLRFIGAGPLSHALHERVQLSPVRDDIELVGARDDIAECMRDLDVYALPSLAEGISNTLLEAMATGLPCVATLVGGNPELIEDGISGILVPAGDAQALMEALSRYTRNAELRRLHGGRARARAVERFGIDRMVAEYDALYTTLLLHRGVVEPDWASQGRSVGLARSGTS